MTSGPTRTCPCSMNLTAYISHHLASANGSHAPTSAHQRLNSLSVSKLRRCGQALVDCDATRNKNTIHTAGTFSHIFSLVMMIGSRLRQNAVTVTLFSTSLIFVFCARIPIACSFSSSSSSCFLRTGSCGSSSARRWARFRMEPQILLYLW